MKDYFYFRIFVCFFILIVHLIGLVFQDHYAVSSEWITIGTVLTVVASFFVAILVLEIRYADGKIRKIITDRGAAILNPIFGVLMAKWLYLSFLSDMYVLPIAISAAIFVAMPLLGNLIYTGNGRYRSVYFYAMGQVIFVGGGILLEILYFSELKGLLQ